MPSILSHRLIPLAALALAALAVPAAPAAAADFAKFRLACHSEQAAAFLLGPEASREQADAVLGVLCPCLEQGFAQLSQPQIDALAADLRTGSSDEAKAKYAGYADLQQTATGVLGVCFSKDEVTRVLLPPASSAPQN